jgi:hypothetical protein
MFVTIRNEPPSDSSCSASGEWGSTWGPEDDLCEVGRVMFRFRASTGELWVANFRRPEVSIKVGYVSDIVGFILAGFNGEATIPPEFGRIDSSGSLVLDGLRISSRRGGDLFITNGVASTDDSHGARLFHQDLMDAVEYLMQFIQSDPPRSL